MANLFPSRRDFMNMNRNFFGDSFDNLFAAASDFSVDIQDKGDSYLVEADLPGINKEEIKLDYHNNVLSISAEQNISSEEKNEEGNYLRRERSTRSYHRQFLIRDADEEKITAKFENGVLTVNLPKKESKETPGTKIDIQ